MLVTKIILRCTVSKTSKYRAPIIWHCCLTYSKLKIDTDGFPCLPDFRGRLVGLVTRLCPERFGIRIRVGTRDFSFLQNVHTGCRAHLASCWMGYRCCFWRVERPEHIVDHTLQSSPELKNEWSYISVPPPPPYSFTMWIRKNLTFISISVLRSHSIVSTRSRFHTQLNGVVNKPRNY